ncbi:MAG: Panacea domain-containing protein [Candidatus Dormiibacterota bacterium]
MKFEFKERKAAEAAARLLQLSGGRMSYMKLDKLLYLADRRSLVETGFVITGDQMCSMEHGPVLSYVLNLLKGDAPPGPDWRKLISPNSGFDVMLVQDPPDEAVALSDYETEVLAAVWTEFGHMDQFQLRDYLHATMPEWENPGKSSKPIDAEAILRLEGWSDSDIAAWSEEVDAVSSMSRLLSGSLA